MSRNHGFNLYRKAWERGLELARLLRAFPSHSTLCCVSTFIFRRTFSKAGYSVALVARGKDVVDQLAEELNASGGDVGAHFCTIIAYLY